MSKPSTTSMPPSHAASAKRINRVIGQLNGIKSMMEERRYCPDILTQLRAARAAIKAVELTMLSNHLNNCVINAVAGGDEKEIKKKLEELETLIERYTE